MKLHSFSTAVLVVLLTSTGLAQDFVTQYDGPDGLTDLGSWCIRTSAGEPVIVGDSFSQATSADFAVLKYDTAGNLQWARHFDGPASGRDWALGATVDLADNIIAAGQVVGIGGTQDIAFVKYDPAGNQLWSYVWDGLGHGEDGTSYANLRCDVAGDIYFCGYSDVGGGDYDGVLLKVSAGGTLLWTRYLSGLPGRFDGTWQVELDAVGNVVAASESPLSTGSAIVVRKYDPAGNLLWEGRHEGASGSYNGVYVLSLDSQGRVFVGGIESQPGGRYDYLLVKFNELGVYQWHRTYNWAGLDDYLFALVVDAAGNAIVSGISDDTFVSAIATLKYDPQGNLLWSQRYRSLQNWWGGDTVGNGLKVDAQGFVWVNGWSYQGPETGFDGVTLLYAPQGDSLGTWLYDSPRHGNDYLHDLMLDDEGHAWGCGHSPNPDTGGRDILVVRYNNPLLHLEASDQDLSAGDSLGLAVLPGQPTTLMLLAAVQVNSIEVFVPIFNASFDSAGEWSLTTTVPPGLAGIEITLQAFGFDQWSDLKATDRETLAFF